MNSHETNENAIVKMETMEPMFEDPSKAEEAKHIPVNIKEPPLAFARKLSSWICLGIWVVSIIMLFTGAELTLILPFMLLALGVVCGLTIPVFVAKKKISDVIISILATFILIFVAIGILFFGA